MKISYGAVFEVIRRTVVQKRTNSPTLLKSSTYELLKEGTVPNFLCFQFHHDWDIGDWTPCTFYLTGIGIISFSSKELKKFSNHRAGYGEF